MIRRLSFIVTVVSLLFGCGGGSEPQDIIENASVNAGEDITVEEKSDIALSAQGSPTGGVFTWQLLEGPTIEGFPLEGQDLSIQAPDVKADTAINLKVEYLAPDGTLVSDIVTVSISSRNQLPIAMIEKTAPETEPLKYNDEIILSAQSSSDPDENGRILEYFWQQESGPTLSFEANDQVTLKFVHPLLSKNESARFKLSVTDDEGGVSSTEFLLALFKNEQLVFADAGQDSNIVEFQKGELNASQSLSATGQFSCVWEQLDRPPTQQTDLIVNPNLCVTTFTAPDVDITSILKFQVMVTEPSGSSDKDSVSVNVQRRAFGENLNDTGQLKCFNEGAVINCDGTNFPNQDAKLGRDSFILNENKIGAGSASFDFTKLDENARAISDSNTSNFSCVKDNNTGLIWEVKLPNSAIPPNAPLRDTRNTYTWFLTGYPNGAKGAGLSTCNSADSCDTQQYIDDVNATNYCGGRNWRLPTFIELMALFNYGEVAGSSFVLDPNYFPFVADPSWTGSSFYWTSQPSVEGATGASDLIETYVFDMLTGETIELEQDNTAYVRLVREVANGVQ